MAARFIIYFSVILSLILNLNCKQEGRYRGMKELYDITFATVDNIKLKLDIYQPEGFNGKRPVMVYIHGGAFRASDKMDNIVGIIVDKFVPEGYSVVSINYRFSFQAKYPAQLHDCKGAIRWIRANSDKYNFDSSRVGVVGESSGGYLAALLGTTGDKKSHKLNEMELDLEGSVGGNTEFSSDVKAVCEAYGPIDFLKMKHTGKNSPEEELIGGPIEKNRTKCILANPSTYISENDPHFFIIHGEDDPFIPVTQSKIFYDNLTNAYKGLDKKVEFKIIKDAGHFDVFTKFDLSLLVNFFNKNLNK